MAVDVVARFVEGKVYALKVSQSVVERFGLQEGKEIPMPVALHLMYVGRAQVFDEKGEKLSFEDLLKAVRDPDTFSVFIVLHDLARRGKSVAVDSGRELVLINENVRVYVVDEDSYLTAEDLYTLVDKSIKLGYRLVIAVVDLNGEVTYYEVGKVDFPRIERR